MHENVEGDEDFPWLNPKHGKAARKIVEAIGMWFFHVIGQLKHLLIAGSKEKAVLPN